MPSIFKPQSPGFELQKLNLQMEFNFYTTPALCITIFTADLSLVKIPENDDISLR